MVNRRGPVKVETCATAKKLGHELLEYCHSVVSQLPLYKDVTFPTAPHTSISEKVEIVYSEVNQENVHKLKAYVEEMCSADQISGSVNILRIQDDVVKLWDVVKSWPEISEEQKNLIKALYDGVVRSLHKVPDNRLQPGIPRTCRSSSQFLQPQLSGITSMSADKIPLLHLKRRMGTQWEYDSNLTGVSFGVLHKIGTSGTTFKDENALITGVGRAPFAIYMTLGLDLDYHSLRCRSENGHEIDGLDDKSELAYRIMLVNLLHCHWLDSWYRSHNMAAQDIDTHGVRTFSAKEMAFNILELMQPILFSITQVKPTWGDLSGGFDRVTDIADITICIHVHQQRAGLCRAIARDNVAEFKVISGAKAERDTASVTYFNMVSRVDVKIPGGVQVERVQASNISVRFWKPCRRGRENLLLPFRSNRKHAYSWNTYLLKCPRSGQADPCAFATTPSSILNDVVVVVILPGGDSVKTNGSN
ncbi:hypothetical protein BC827DRAFT_1381136 [Russula dissimulans]|nr:hypothetical protein BC827DRAFT_1381136 [Russula dissimulans]